MAHMKLIDMKTKCRMCGKELIADDKDDDFVSFYCMKCGVYTTRPVDYTRGEEGLSSDSNCAGASISPIHQHLYTQFAFASRRRSGNRYSSANPRAPVV
jgi:predicted RNA-binding Zn-ribbon protein involved in translation (DUF1610 family)